MSEFFTNYFWPIDQGTQAVDKWLSGLQKPGYGITIIGYAADNNKVFITVKRWRLQGTSLLSSIGSRGAQPGPTTIDEIPEEPSIQTEEPEEEQV